MSEPKPLVTIDDFAKLDLRIGTIVSAERVPDTDKLIRFEIDLGTEKRQILAGFATGYPDPSVLVGTQVPVLINLEPRMLRGLESQGMVLAPSDENGHAVALHPDKKIEPGTVVK